MYNTDNNTNNDANPNDREKTTKKISKKKFLKEKEEQKKETQEKEKQEGTERKKRVNALYSPMQKAFDEMQKEMESTKKVEDMDFEISNINGMQLLNDGIDEIPKLVEPILHRVGIAAIIGSSDVGKSSLLRHLCVCIVTGRKFLEWEVKPIHKRALYVSTEDDQMSISSLLKKQNKDYKLKPEELENLVYIFETDNLLFRLESELKEKPVDLIIVDAFADLFTAELYKTNEVRGFLNNYNQLAQRYGCLIIFLHHTRKSSEDLQPSKNNSLGSQGFEAKMRFMAEIKTNLTYPNKKHFCIVKGNYLSYDFKTKSFDIEFTENLTFKSLGTCTPFDRLNKIEESYESLESEYDNILSMKDQGLSIRDIALKLNISHSTVINRMKRFERLKKLNDTKE